MRAEVLKGHLDGLLLATLEAGPRRRSYVLTAAGRRALAAERSQWREFSSAVSALLEGRPWPAPA